MRKFLKEIPTETLDFMDGEVDAKPLTVGQVEEIKEISKMMQGDNPEADELDGVRYIIRSSVEEANDLTDEEFNQLPMEAITKLSNDILAISGLGDDEDKKKRGKYRSRTKN